MRRLGSIRAFATPLLAFVVLIACCGLGSDPAAAQAEVVPVVPFGLYSTHWDHHWFAWLPRHPDFEAVEVMSTQMPDSKPLVWVFFTERRPPKRQTSYVNDRAVARATGWQYRDIDYNASGAPGGPLDLSVRMVSDGGIPVTIAIGFDPATVLRHRDSTLTPQIGHGAADRFLMFHRGEDAIAAHSSVVVGAEDVSLPIDGQPDPLPFHAAYSHDIFVGSIPFTETHWSFAAQDAGPPGSVRFDRLVSQDGGGCTYVAAAGAGRRVELVVDANGGLESYTDTRWNRALQVRFQPPLPGVGSTASGAAAFSIAYGDLGTIVTGDVRYAGDATGLRMDWQPRSPAWAQDYPFQSRAERAGPDAITVTTSPGVQSDPAKPAP